MKIVGIIFAIIALIAISFFIVAGVWWAVLWSFNFPVVFAWKQVIGVFLMSVLMNISVTTKG